MISYRKKILSIFTLSFMTFKYSKEESALFYQHPIVYLLPSVTLLCLIFISTVDKQLAFFCKEHLPPAWKIFFNSLTGLGRSWVWYTMVAGAFFVWHLQAHYSDAMTRRRRKLRAQSRVALWLLMAMLGSGFLVAVLKLLLGRARPHLLFEQGLYGFHLFSGLDWAQQSFPSGHSQIIWVVTTVLTILWPHYRLIFIILGGLVSTSRVVTTVHYLSDVVMGSFLGISCTVFLREFFYQQNGYAHTDSVQKKRR